MKPTFLSSVFKTFFKVAAALFLLLNCTTSVKAQTTTTSNTDCWIWIDAKTGKPVPTVPESGVNHGAATITGAGAAEIDPTQPNRAYNAKTGQNFVKNPDGTWIDSKTGETVPTVPESGVNHGAATIQGAGAAEIDPLNPNRAYNPKTGQNFVRVPCPKPPFSTAPVKPASQLYFGAALILEDSKPKFNTYGVSAAFTSFLNPVVGITGDLGLTFGTSNMVDYRKLTVMGGVTVNPFQQVGLNSSVNVYTHLLVGISSINSSISTYSNTYTTFAGELGAGINIPIKNGFLIRPIEINYQFATPGGGLSSNIKFSAGVVANLK